MVCSIAVRPTVVSVVLLVLIVANCTCFAQVNDIAVLGVADFTKDSVGDVISGPATGVLEKQSSRGAAGLSIDYWQWWSNNAASLSYTATPTDSKLSSKYGVTPRWGITRNEFDVSWVRRIRKGRISPYAMTGIGAILLNGGKESGLDRQFAIIAGTGSDIRVSSNIRFRCGLNVDFLRASNFSDRNYRGGRTLILQPKFGFVWTFRSRRKQHNVPIADSYIRGIGCSPSCQ
jgi:hypothetical protein